MNNVINWLSMALFPVLAACGTTNKAPIQGDGVAADCAGGETYPPGAREPMALGETLVAYAWPDAVDRRTGARVSLDLGQVPCATDPDIDWTPFEALLFVSIPAW